MFGALSSLNLFDFVTGSAAFALEISTVNVLADTTPGYQPGVGTGDLDNAILTTIALSNANLFIGVNGNSNGQAGNGTGFAVTGASLAIAAIRPSAADVAAGDSRSYLAVRAKIGSATLSGVDSSTLTVALKNLTLEINRASGRAADATINSPETRALNWTTDIDQDGNGLFGDTIDPGAILPTPTELAIAYTGKLLRASGYASVTVSEFVHVSGNVSIELGDNLQVTLAGSASTSTVSVLKIGASSINAFVGVGGPYWDDNSGPNGVPDGIIDSRDTPKSSEALGLALSNLQIALVLMKPVVAAGQPAPTRSYYALKASGDVALVGVEGLEISARQLSIEVNSASDSAAAAGAVIPVIDFTKLSGGKLTVSTGPSSSVDIGFTDRLLRATGLMTLSIQQYIYVSGNFAFEKGTDLTNVKLTDNSTIERASLLKVGASNVYAFAGVGGPYWQDNSGPAGAPDGIIDELDTPLSTGAMGVVLRNLSFALGLVKELPPTGPPPSNLRSFYALKGSGSLSLVGLDDFQISAPNLTLEVNGGTMVNPPVTGAPAIQLQATDFDQSIAGIQPLLVRTGPNPADT
ncbi:MAG: hypothetical protein ACKOUR_13155, partial [Planctomycetota bacterium]